MVQDADHACNDDATRRWTVSRTAAAEIAWRSAQSWHEGGTLAASALWTGNAAAFERPPIVVLDPNPAALEEKIVDGMISAALTTGAATAANIACMAVGDVLAPGLGQVAGPICGMLAIGETDMLRRAVHRRITGRPVNSDAALVGAIVGCIAGNYAAMYLTQSARFGSYAAYEKAARSMNEKAYRAELKAIAPRDLRGTI